jgi:D-glycero-alpha-D-manno-heptose 1-phosphate guanylyltransferase
MTASCIILAGGLGTRLRSAVPDLPKCLAPVGGRPFLEWQLRSLTQRGVTHFVLALGHGAEQVREALCEPWAQELAIDYVIERETLGTGGAALYAMNDAGLDEALVANGDTFLGGSLAAMLSPLDLHGGELMRIATVAVADRARFGGVAVDGAGHVTAFLEKGQADAGPINAGLYRINRRALDGSAERSFSMETLVMPRLVAQRALGAREVSGPFIDIGIPEDYRYFNEHYQDYISEA